MQAFRPTTSSGISSQLMCHLESVLRSGKKPLGFSRQPAANPKTQNVMVSKQQSSTVLDASSLSAHPACSYSLACWLAA